MQKAGRTLAFLVTFLVSVSACAGKIPQSRMSKPLLEQIAQTATAAPPQKQGATLNPIQKPDNRKAPPCEIGEKGVFTGNTTTRQLGHVLRSDEKILDYSCAPGSDMLLTNKRLVFLASGKGIEEETNGRAQEKLSVLSRNVEFEPERITAGAIVDEKNAFVVFEDGTFGRLTRDSLGVWGWKLKGALRNHMVREKNPILKPFNSEICLVVLPSLKEACVVVLSDEKNAAFAFDLAHQPDAKTRIEPTQEGFRVSYGNGEEQVIKIPDN